MLRASVKPEFLLAARTGCAQPSLLLPAWDGRSGPSRDKSQGLRQLGLIAADVCRPPRRRWTWRAVQVAEAAGSLPSHETLLLPRDKWANQTVESGVARPPDAVGCHIHPGERYRAHAGCRNSTAVLVGKTPSTTHCSSTPPENQDIAPRCPPPGVQQTCHSPASCQLGMRSSRGLAPLGFAQPRGALPKN